ncbi:hypothetical protein KKG41_03965 [Patescibacteria group bacterium]|nr:hypothetical protein [Patescibacteria group bacterium]
MVVESGGENQQDFGKIIDGLSLSKSKALLGVLVRDTIIAREDFRHVVAMEGDELERNLNELKKLGIIQEEDGAFSLTPQFREYWESSKDDREA